LDINYELEKNIKLIMENEIPEDNFNKFAVDFYLLTKSIMISLNKFLNLRGIRNPKILQIKNAGELIYLSRDSIKIRDFLRANSYEEVPEITPQIAYYVIKKNKYSMEQNWENILQVLREGSQPSRFMANKRIILNEEQKKQVRDTAKDILLLKEHEIDWIIEKLKILKREDKDIFEKFKAIF